eukprot:9655778-Alexandrium_andersonii.AAC.1
MPLPSSRGGSALSEPTSRSIGSGIRTLRGAQPSSRRWPMPQGSTYRCTACRASTGMPCGT